MGDFHVRLGTSAAVKERRLAALLEGRDPRDPVLLAALAEAEIAGTLALAGDGAADPTPSAVAVQAMKRARTAVAEDAPLSAGALQSWHEALFGSRDFRVAEAAPPGRPPGAPPALIASRLLVLEEWISGDSGRQLKPAEQGALALARVMEILPFERGNGRVSRLAASHLMVRAGARPPIFRAADRPRLDAALHAAYQLHTGPLVELLLDASDRALDVLIAAAGGAGAGVRS